MKHMSQQIQAAVVSELSELDAKLTSTKKDLEATWEHQGNGVIYMVMGQN